MKKKILKMVIAVPNVGENDISKFQHPPLLHADMLLHQHKHYFSPMKS